MYTWYKRNVNGSLELVRIRFTDISHDLHEEIYCVIDADVILMQGTYLMGLFCVNLSSGVNNV